MNIYLGPKCKFEKRTFFLNPNKIAKNSEIKSYLIFLLWHECSEPKDSRQKSNIDIKKYFKHTNKAIMSSQSNMAKESYPYKIIQSGYALSSSHKVFKSCTIRFQPSNRFILQYFQTFSTFTQYMSVSHGHSTIGGIEWWLWRRQKGGEDSLTSTRRINRLWRCPSIDINVSEQGLPCNGCTRAISI